MAMLATGARGTQPTPQNGDGQGDQDSAATRYQVLRREDEGTLFITYRVRDRASKRILALKALKENFARHAHFTSALCALAEANLELSHPNIAELVEVGREDGTLFLVEEWLRGPTLETHLRHAPLSPQETIDLMRQIAIALDYLHRQGRTHGDLRPRQVLFSDEQNVKLTDTGLSDAFTQAGISLTDLQNEAARYWSPQRFEGTPAQPSDDLYAAGVLLYRMLAGRVPFDGNSTLGIGTRHRADTPLRPTQFNPSCARELETIAFRLLEKSPNNRYSSAADLLVALDEARAEIAPDSQVEPAPVAVETDMEPDSDSAAIAATASQRATSQKLRRKVKTAAAAPVVDVETARRKHGKREMIGAFLSIFWSLLSVALLVGVFYGAYYFWVQSLPQEVTVPKYVGLNQYDAERALEARGLKMKVVREPYDSRRKAGTVLWGSKPTGQNVRSGAGVDVAVSKGKQPIKMYDLVELSLDQARKIAERHGLRLGQIAERYDDKVPKGYIVGQYPEPGQPLRRTDPISLVISRGNQPSDETLEPDALPPRPPTDLDNDDEPPSIEAGPETPNSTMVSRVARVRVVLPANGGSQRVRVEVEDKDGRHTVYDEKHDAGDLVDEVVQVIREQGATATIRIYVGGKLTKTMRV